MTTVAYRDGVLAADGRGCNSQWISSETEIKVRRLSDGRLVAGTGESERHAGFISWLESGAPNAEHPDLGDGCRIIVVHGNGRRTIYEGRGSFEEGRGFGAWGSGGPAALGAMHAGASAVDAVRAASKVDVYTGGRIRWLALKAR